MHIPVIVGMCCSRKRSVTETTSDVGVERSVSRPSLKKATERCYRKMELNALNQPKIVPVTKPLAVVNDATFVLRTAA